MIETANTEAIKTTTSGFFQFVSEDEILVRPNEKDAIDKERSRFTVYWIQNGVIHCQNRHDNMPHYIHRVTRNNKRPLRLI
ncbi:hypothetical protein [Nocardia nova]|uniref:hypothetical protein n=1 Tax=Nocardia nova TaxID=37330 RepID=UPI0034036FDC